MLGNWHKDGWDRLRNTSRLMVRKTWANDWFKHVRKVTKAVFKNKRFYPWHPDKGDG